jgi:hypothetical protein
MKAYRIEKLGDVDGLVLGERDEPTPSVPPQDSLGISRLLGQLSLAERIHLVPAV